MELRGCGGCGLCEGLWTHRSLVVLLLFADPNAAFDFNGISQKFYDLACAPNLTFECRPESSSPLTSSQVLDVSHMIRARPHVASWHAAAA